MTAIQSETAAPSGAETTVEHVLTLDCPEGPGIVHAVSGFLLEHGCDIIDNKQFGDRAEGHFFMRVHFASTGDESTVDALRASFAPVGEKYGMNWQLERQGYKRKVLIMVSKFGHCLNDLLFRARIGELPIDVVGVVSNHLDHQGLAEWHGIPYFHVPVTAATKPAAEARLLELIDELDVELVVLARYMQVLSDDLARKLDGRAIN
ncbi:MAG TPA: formyltransferase family protein, partial [Paenarthrobacter sp.]|nr:formyltransferase family protein [Paenarthrobacter sp.]